MAYTDIDDPSAHFQATTYTGAGANTEVTNSGNSDLKPDFLWIKNRTASYGHFVVDSNRNISYEQNSSNAPYLETESTAAENSNQNWMQSVNTDGFTTGISEHINNNSGSAYVAWQWKANGGTTSSNTDGSITSTVQANQDAGFSIITYTGNGTAGATFGHGLGVAPSMVIVKKRSATPLADHWGVWHKGLTSAAYYLLLNSTAAQANSWNIWNSTAPSSSVVTLGNDSTGNYNGQPYIAYCFAEKQGYSKFGKYVGNGSTNGPFVYTGFKPAFVMIKKSNSTNQWLLFDNARDPSNKVFHLLRIITAAEVTTINDIDFLSNGFKIRDIVSSDNGSGDTFIYMAFAENPFTTSTGIPTTAR